MTDSLAVSPFVPYDAPQSVVQWSAFCRNAHFSCTLPYRVVTVLYPCPVFADTEILTVAPFEAQD